MFFMNLLSWRIKISRPELNELTASRLYAPALVDLPVFLAVHAAIGLTVQLMGIEVTSISLYAIAGMGAMVAGIIGMVMAAIIALIEMTGNLSPSLPLLFSVTCTYVVIYLYSQSSLLVRQLNGRNKNPFVEIKAHDKKYEGVIKDQIKA